MLCFPIYFFQAHRGTVLLGYEQCNKYSIYDENGNVVALLAEDWSGVGSEVGR